MSALALTLVLAAAVIHATWNYLLKRSGGGTLFVWAFATLSALIYAPLALGIVWWQQPALGWMSLALIIASAVIHTAYYLLLDRGYRTGDLSLVYPLARGSAPLITVAGAVFLLHERPTGLAVISLDQPATYQAFWRYIGPLPRSKRRRKHRLPSRIRQQHLLSKMASMRRY